MMYCGKPKSERMIWAVKMKEINEMIVELNLAFQAICWAHGLHN